MKARCIKDSLEASTKRVSVSRPGLTRVDTSDSGKKTRCTDSAPMNLGTAMFTKACLKMESCRVSECLKQKMSRSSGVSGRMISRTGGALKLGRTASTFQASMEMELSKGSAITSGVRVILTLESGLITRLTEKVLIFGLMAGFITDLGKLILCTEKEFISGPTEDSIVEIMRTTRRKAKVSISGLITDVI